MSQQNEVKERPILFSGPMVKAILEGRKTQTRRIIKPMPFIDYPTGFRLQQQYKLDHHPKCSFVQAKMLCDCQAIYEPWKNERIAACPYGKPGDRLWVRETHSFERVIEKDENSWLSYSKVHYRATEPELPGLVSGWKPSIFMPRWASRITLEVTGVRVERVQDISDQDAIAEGIEDIGAGDLRGMYAVLWSSINDKRGFGWAFNPWVWVIKFKKL